MSNNMSLPPDFSGKVRCREPFSYFPAVPCRPPKQPLSYFLISKCSGSENAAVF